MTTDKEAAEQHQKELRKKRNQKRNKAESTERKYQDFCKKQLSCKPTEDRVRQYRKAYKDWMKDKTKVKPAAITPHIERAEFGYQMNRVVS